MLMATVKMILFAPQLATHVVVPWVLITRTLASLKKVRHFSQAPKKPRGNRWSVLPPNSNGEIIKHNSVVISSDSSKENGKTMIIAVSAADAHPQTQMMIT